MRQYLREGKAAQAKEIAEKLKGSLGPGYAMVATCIKNPSSPEIASMGREAVAVRLADPDPEPRYVVAGDLLYCGQKDGAAQLVKSAICGTLLRLQRSAE